MVLLVSTITMAYTQQEIRAHDVYYAKVDSIFPTNDTIKVADLSSFKETDKVLIFQVNGARYLNDPPQNETPQFRRKTGYYEIISIKSIDPANKLIVFIDALQREFDNGEAIQIAKVVEHNIGIVNQDINVQDWDGAVGGVFPILTYSKLILNADIDASGAGFRGADPSADPDYTRGCTMDATKFIHTDSTLKAALKGEGFISYSVDYTRGIGRAANGGGGSNGKFGGGGGGANYGSGGTGGKQSGGCSNMTANGGKLELTAFYQTESNRIAFGGGGGTSTQDVSHIATKGSDGGGLILILTDTLESNGGSLISKGESVAGVATAGAGGGGAGGTVLLDYSVITGNLNIDISGGEGGAVENTDVCTGAGGGGGGGVLWYSGNTFPALASVDSSGGEPGQIEQECLSNLAFEGKPGGAIGNLRLPLTGFLFNFITGTDTICAGQVPDTIKASMPRGGDGNFNYLWQYSLDSMSWNDYPADAADSLFFTPDPLDTTTFFRRVVTSVGQFDTSKTVKIFVWPAIENNQIAENQILCYQEQAETLSGNQPTGGDNQFFFRWEKSNDLSDWQGIDSSTTNQSYAPGIMVDTTYYRRYIQSVKVCKDYSNTVTIIVQPDLLNYQILGNQDECYGYIPEKLTGAGTVEGGDHVDYYYFWERKEETGPWLFIDNDTTAADFQPPPLTDTTQYRRIVSSGVCIDTSNSITINIQPPIENNLIFEDHKICYGDVAPVLNDNGPMMGGNHTEYVNIWQKSLNVSTWSAPENNDSTAFLPGQLFETGYYRRVVNSGACYDTSNVVEIEVVPQIFNNLSTPDTTLCYGFAPNHFEENPASGGYGNFFYDWQRKPQFGNEWSDTPNAGDKPEYSPEKLTETMLFRRVVTSDICTHYSDTIQVTVLPFISNNLISGAPLTYTCYQIPMELEATMPSGGNEGQYVYTWEKSLAGNQWTEADMVSSSKNYITPALTDTIFYRRLVFSGQYNQCKDTSEMVLVRIHDLPTGQINSDYDTAICDGQKIDLDIKLTGKSPWNVYLNENFSEVLNDTLDQMEIDFNSTDIRKDHSITFDSIVDANNCRATDMSGSVFVTSVEVPDPEIIQMDDVCEGIAPIEAASPKFMAYWQSEYATFDDSTSQITEAYGLRYDTTVIISWTEINDICTTTVSDSLIFYRQPDENGIPTDTVLYNKFELELTTNAVSFGNVLWKILEEEAFVAEQSETNALFSFPWEHHVTYNIVYEIENGECLQSDTMLVEVEDVTRPNAFSPNGDGINDFFYIEGIEDAITSELYIFNSWGRLVREYKDYHLAEPLWDGTDENGQPLPNGTYYYVLSINNNERHWKGFIVIRRSAAGQ